MRFMILVIDRKRQPYCSRNLTNSFHVVLQLTYLSLATRMLTMLEWCPRFVTDTLSSGSFGPAYRVLPLLGMTRSRRSPVSNSVAVISFGLSSGCRRRRRRCGFRCILRNDRRWRLRTYCDSRLCSARRIAKSEIFTKRMARIWFRLGRLDKFNLLFFFWFHHLLSLWYEHLLC